jgi:NADPH:quinone reductase-like Zn-dependent oxidoreductase
MSRVIGFTQYGGPDVLTYSDIDVPAPASNEVRIQVKAIGLNRAESMWRSGAYVEPVRLPARLGYESAGLVEAVGSDVTHVSVGDRVSTVPSFSLNDYGMYGELVLAPAHAVVKLPDWLSFEQGTALWNVFITPYGALIESGLLKAGDFVLIPAASSAVGLGTIQIVNSAGATAIAMTRTRAKRDELLKAGAAHVIVTDEQDLVAQVNRITEGRGVDIVFEPVGGANFPKLIDALTPGGTLFIYGALAPEPTPLPLLSIIYKQPIIRGYNLFSTTTDAARQQAAVTYIFNGLESGQLKTEIAANFAFDDMIAAHRELEKNQHLGKIVVNV